MCPVVMCLKVEFILKEYKFIIIPFLLYYHPPNQSIHKRQWYIKEGTFYLFF